MTAANDRRGSPGDEAPRRAFLTPGEHIDSNHPQVIGFANARTRGANGEREAAVRLYYAVRDDIRYDAYMAGSTVEVLRASDALRAKRGWCVSKAVLLAACARAVGMGARVGFADVRNHLSTARMREFMGTDVFYYHGYAQLHVEGQWVKATPAFNIELCEKMGLLPLEFDGLTDSLYHPFDCDGRAHMEYIRDHGVFDAVPVAAMVACWGAHYRKADPSVADSGEWSAESTDFDCDVEAELEGN
jgi:transglutaminase-like putative cysteine protease